MALAGGAVDVVLVVASADLLVEDCAVAAVECVLLPPRMAEVVHLTQNTSYTVMGNTLSDQLLNTDHRSLKDQ